MKEEELLTVEQVADERLHCGRTFAWDLVGSGQIRSVKLGRLRRVPASAVDDFIRRLEEQQAEGAE
jgi:excisionase family DNA binding protein